MRAHRLFLENILIIALTFILIACQPATLPAPSTPDDDIQDIRVQVAEPTRTTTKVEQFPLPNCGGTERLAQSLGTYASASKSATVGAKATVAGGGEVAIRETAKLKLEIQVELSYKQTFESANSRLDTIEMSAAKGTHVVYTLVWEEQTFNSIVQYSSNGKVYEAPYIYKLSVPKIAASYNVICPGNGTGNAGSGDATVAQPATQISAPPTSISPTPNNSTGSEGNSCNWADDWKLQSEGSYLWVGLPPGTPYCANVGQDGDLLRRLRNGENLTLVVEVGDAPMNLAICRGNYSAKTVKPGKTCSQNPEEYPKVTGRLVVTGSDGFLVGIGK
jgi:hypothetical protein